jgi:hypothetical protein
LHNARSSNKIHMNTAANLEGKISGKNSLLPPMSHFR